MNTISDLGLGSPVKMAKVDVTGWSVIRLLYPADHQ